MYHVLKQLSCDYHIHTEYPDGASDFKRAVDIFRQAGLDVISITVHIFNENNSLGKLFRKVKFSVTEGDFNGYLHISISTVNLQ